MTQSDTKTHDTTGHNGQSGSAEHNIERLRELVIDDIEHGATFREMSRISGDTMAILYAQAYALYQGGRLDEAESFFRFLCIYDFQNVDYILGLAAVLQIRKEYRKALDLYAMGYTMSGGDHRALLYAGQCNLLLRRVGNAKHCFEALICDVATCEHIRIKAQGYLDTLLNSAAGKERDDEAQVHERVDRNGDEAQLSGKEGSGEDIK
ncbi:tetratricopeptide repeat protein [Burkholderia sp. Nafp2/4-1b]|uniref:tetratricopeptide repeat protein n=1 Tax=Burkholderia sp. Nafp2/4-1b TaxID=2116686 RepID=UPI0013CE5458|nr:tetratricopeptide repeat protein [Burkholderia sp. Nafp2/4-1b]